MPVMKMRNLGSVGVITDLPSYELPPNAWSDALNVRFQGNRISSIGGNLPVLERGMPDNTIPLTISGYNFDEKGIGASWVYGTSDSLYKTDSATHTLISKRVDGSQDGSKAAHAYTVRDNKWDYTIISNALVMNTQSEPPQGIIGEMEFFEDLPNWGKTAITYNSDGSVESATESYWRANKIRTYKNFLIALNTTEGASSSVAENYPQRIRWSDITDINQLPRNWDDSSTTNSAGFNDLTNAEGIIIDGIPMRDMFVVYTSNDVFVMQYIGGNSIFRFTKLFNDSGLLSSECAVEFEGKHFVVSPDDIYVHNGSTKQTVVSNKIRERLINEITSVNAEATKVFANAGSKEIWVTYVTPGSSTKANYCNRAAIWNWEFNTWTFYELPAITDINMVNIPLGKLKTWDEFDKQETWADIPGSWTRVRGNFLNQQIVASSNHGRFYLLDTGDSFYSKEDDLPTGKASVAKLPRMLERDFIDFDEMGIDPWQNKRIRRIYPQFSGQGKIQISIQGNPDPSEKPLYNQNQTFDMSKDIKSDFRINDKYISVRFEDLSGSEWSLAGYDLDFILGGRR